MTQDSYELLGVAYEATPEEIRRAYRDKVGAAQNDLERFQALSKAFETLKDPTRRAAYDKRRLLGFPPEDDDDAEEHGRLGRPIAPKNTTQNTMQQPSPYSNRTAMPTQGMPAGATMSGATVVVPQTGAFGLSGPTSFGVPTSGPCAACGSTALPDEGFCRECGFLVGSAMGATLIARPLPKLTDTNGREYPLKLGDNSVGREGADVMLPDKSVSRRHARIVVEENGAVWIEDFGSTNGSRVGLDPLAAGQKKSVSDGLELRFGVVRVTINIPAPPGGEVLALPMPKETGGRTRLPIAALNAPAGMESVAARLLSAEGEDYTLSSETVTVGRRPDNSIVITGDPYVSGSHAQLVYENAKFKLFDVGSTNGTRLNGRKLLPHAPQVLSDGDEIVFGQTAYTFKAPPAS